MALMERRTMRADVLRQPFLQADLNYYRTTDFFFKRRRQERPMRKSRCCLNRRQARFACRVEYVELVAQPAALGGSLAASARGLLRLIDLAGRDRRASGILAITGAPRYR